MNRDLKKLELLFEMMSEEGANEAEYVDKPGLSLLKVRVRGRDRVVLCEGGVLYIGEGEEGISKPQKVTRSLEDAVEFLLEMVNK